MRSTKLVSLLLALVPTAFGCGDDIIFPTPEVPELPDPAVNGVFPAAGFSGRTLRVQISGDATEFTDAAAVAFSGNGITVDDVTLASPSLLFADITIAPDAELSVRDITVTDGDATFTIAQSFEVRNALLMIPDSSLAQGGVGFIRVINLDPENPFIGGDLDIVVDGGASLTVLVDAGVTLDQFTALVLLDADASPTSLLVQDGLTGVVSSTNVLTPQNRTPTELQPIGKGGGTLIGATATLSDLTLLFSFTAESAITVGQGFNNSFSLFPPLLIWLPDGKWANSRGFTDLSLIPTTDNQNMMLVVLDPDFITGDEYDIEVDQLEPLPNVTNVAQVEPNDTIAQAQTGAAETLYTGTLTDVDDEDFVKVTLTENQSIRVFTTSGSFGEADTDIDIQDDTGAVIDGSGDSDFIELGEFVETAPLPAGDYFVVLKSSPAGDPSNTPYEASIVVFDNNL